MVLLPWRIAEGRRKDRIPFGPRTGMCRRSPSQPDWAKHGKAAPFKPNDQMLNILPMVVMHFPGTGIQDNLADKAKKIGIPV